MKDAHSSALGALDSFFEVVRRQADKDPDFATQLIQALKIPIEIRIETSADVKANLLHLDPRVLAGDGELAFRERFTPLSDADKRKVAKHFNLLEETLLKGTTAPKGAELVSLMWETAKAQRERMDRRT